MENSFNLWRRSSHECVCSWNVEHLSVKIGRGSSIIIILCWIFRRNMVAISSSYLWSHDGNSRWWHLSTDDILPQRRVLQITKIGHSTSNPHLVLISCISELRMDTWTSVKEKRKSTLHIKYAHPPPHTHKHFYRSQISLCIYKKDIIFNLAGQVVQLNLILNTYYSDNKRRLIKRININQHISHHLRTLSSAPLPADLDTCREHHCLLMVLEQTHRCWVQTTAECYHHLIVLSHDAGSQMGMLFDH